MQITEPSKKMRCTCQENFKTLKDRIKYSQPSSASAAIPRLLFRFTCCSFFSEPSKISPRTLNPQIQSVVRRLSSPSRIDAGASAKRDSALGGTSCGKVAAAAAKAATDSKPCIDPLALAGIFFGMPLEGGNA